MKLKLSNRVLAALLSLVMLVGLISTAVFAAGDVGKAIQLGTGSISGWFNTDGYDYVYYVSFASINRFEFAG